MSVWLLSALALGQLAEAGTPTVTATVGRVQLGLVTSSVAESREDSWTPRDLLDLFDFTTPSPKPAETARAPTQRQVTRALAPELPPLWTAILWVLLLFTLGRWLRRWPLPSGLRRGLPLIETGLWVLWLGVFSSIAWARGSYVWVVVLCSLSLPPLLSVGRRLTGGIQFWLSSGLREGAAVEVDGHPGALRRISAFDLEVETEEGWLVRVPYADVPERLRVRSQSRARRVAFEVPLHENQDPKSARERMVELVLSSSWSRLEEPVVRLAGDRILRVEANVVEADAKSLLVSDVQRAWAELKPPAPRSSSVPRGPSAASS